MEYINKLVLGCGISAISFAHFYNKEDYLIIEKTDRLGGLCKSFKIGESIFDFSGHFLHFNNHDMEKYIKKLVEKHATGEFKTYERKAGIAMTYETGMIDKLLDYPFQANIHQLDKESFLECLVDFWNAPLTRAREHDDLLGMLGDPNNFEELLRRIFGHGITDMFFKSYNEKLYCTDLKNISAEGMKRFIPKVTFDDVINNFKMKKEFGYNSTFLYSPTSGIQGLIDAFLKEKNVNVTLNETVIDIDLTNKIVKTNKRTITYETLINTLPLDLFTKLAQQPRFDLKSVNVGVYNFTYEGDASPVIKDKCWVYVPDKRIPFYRVGYYSYMSKKSDTSIYVEVAFESDSIIMHSLDSIDIALRKHRFIDDNAKVKDRQQLLISPAYVILEKDTEEKVSKYRESLKMQNVYLTGRYGKWEYSSIEDTIIDAKELANKLSLT